MSRQQMLSTTLAVLWTISSAVGCSAVLDFGECGVNAGLRSGICVLARTRYCVTASSLYNGPHGYRRYLSFRCGSLRRGFHADNQNVLHTVRGVGWLGLPMEQGITLAVEDFNSRGGIGPAN